MSVQATQPEAAAQAQVSVLRSAPAAVAWAMQPGVAVEQVRVSVLQSVPVAAAPGPAMQPEAVVRAWESVLVLQLAPVVVAPV